MSTSNPNINKMVLDYVDVTGRTIGTAVKIAEQAEAASKAAAERMPKTRDLLKKAGLIDDTNVKKAEQQLTNHANVLDILGNVINHYEDKIAEIKKASLQEKTAKLGEGVDDSAKQTVKHANYAGYRRGYADGPSEADKKLLRLIGR